MYSSSFLLLPFSLSHSFSQTDPFNFSNVCFTLGFGCFYSMQNFRPRPSGIIKPDGGWISTEVVAMEVVGRLDICVFIHGF